MGYPCVFQRQMKILKMTLPNLSNILTLSLILQKKLFLSTLSIIFKIFSHANRVNHTPISQLKPNSYKHGNLSAIAYSTTIVH